MELKRNHTEELYKITVGHHELPHFNNRFHWIVYFISQKDYETNIYEMNEEHTQEVSDLCFPLRADSYVAMSGIYQTFCLLLKSYLCDDILPGGGDAARG